MDATEVWRAQPLDGIFEVRHLGAGAYSLRAARFHELREMRGRGVAEDQPWRRVHHDAMASALFAMSWAMRKVRPETS